MSNTDLLSLSHLCPADHPTHAYSSWPSIPPHPIGRQVLITPEVTARAAKEEILTGKKFALDKMIYPSGGGLYSRMKPFHAVLRCDSGPYLAEDADIYITEDPERQSKRQKTDSASGEKKKSVYNPTFDDFVHFNTQTSTQWDYFLHFSYPGSGLFYAGLTAEKVACEDTGDIGVAAIARAGGVQTRALFVDVPYYLEKTGQEALDPISYPGNVALDVTFFKKALEFFKLTPRPGDVLLLRTGYEAVLREDRVRVAAGELTRLGAFKHAGALQSDEMVKWIWENGFVACGSDNPTFEAWKPQYPDLLLHPILLSGMGIMIGELMHLEEAAQECINQQRWSFFISSVPIMVEHGVASPPNAVAIF